MPDSLPLSTRSRQRKGTVSPQEDGQNRQVSANNIAGATCCLATPPRDVGRLLEQHGSSLPRYLDIQRWRQIQDSRERWALLRHGLPPEAGKPA
jgi:hypothetical protein